MLDREVINRGRALTNFAAEGVEQIYDFGTIDGFGFTLTQYVPGASLDGLSCQRHEHPPISWALALLLFLLGQQHLAALAEAGLFHGRLTRKLLRVNRSCELCLCLGLPNANSPANRENALLQDLLALGRAVFPLAAPASEADRIELLLTSEDPTCTKVLADYIVERVPQLGDLVSQILWRPLRVDQATELITGLDGLLTTAEILAFTDDLCSAT